MKKWIVILTALFIWQKWGAIQHWLNPPDDFSRAHDGKVLLYATDWCGYCEKTRVYLKEKSIPYFEYDIEKSAEGLAQYKALGGTGGVPLVLVNGTVIKGYSPMQIQQAMP